MKGAFVIYAVFFILKIHFKTGIRNRGGLMTTIFKKIPPYLVQDLEVSIKTPHNSKAILSNTRVRTGGKKHASNIPAPKAVTANAIG